MAHQKPGVVEGDASKQKSHSNQVEKLTLLHVRHDPGSISEGPRIQCNFNTNNLNHSSLEVSRINIIPQ